jgi:hypothetical protein
MQQSVNCSVTSTLDSHSHEAQPRRQQQHPSVKHCVSMQAAITPSSLLLLCHQSSTINRLFHASAAGYSHQKAVHMSSFCHHGCWRSCQAPLGWSSRRKLSWLDLSCLLCRVCLVLSAECWLKVFKIQKAASNSTGAPVLEFSCGVDHLLVHDLWKLWLETCVSWSLITHHGLGRENFVSSASFFFLLINTHVHHAAAMLLFFRLHLTRKMTRKLPTDLFSRCSVLTLQRRRKRKSRKNELHWESLSLRSKPSQRRSHCCGKESCQSEQLWIAAMPQSHHI